VEWNVIADEAESEVTRPSLNDLASQDDMLDVADIDTAFAQDKQVVGINNVFLASDFLSDELNIHPTSLRERT